MSIHEMLYDMATGLHKAGLVSDEELREWDLECRPRRARWRALLGEELFLWSITVERFFYWDHDWQRRVESFLRKRLGGFWFGRTDNREALSHD